jgi:hypothetical protein
MGRACRKDGEERNAYRVLVESQKERDLLESQDVGG